MFAVYNIWPPRLGCIALLAGTATPTKTGSDFYTRIDRIVSV